MPGSARRDTLLRKRLDVFARMLPGVEQGDVRALHRARVASRRLRELVPVLQLDEATAAKLTRRLRKVTTKLGRVRELDVLLLLVDELEAAGTYDRRALDRVRSTIVQNRSSARAALVENGTFGRMQRLAARLRIELEKLRDEAPHKAGRAASGPVRGWQWAIDARVARRAARLRAAIEDAGTVYLPERLHDVRIAVKKLRYSMELAAEARRQKPNADLRALARGQEVLGRLHDFQVLIGRARRIADAPAAEPAATRLDHLIEALETDCRHLHAAYLRERATLVAICERVAKVAPRERSRDSAPVRRSA